jgi:molybdopterin-containing oxidoreductase family membrane subunit
MYSPTIVEVALFLGTIGLFFTLFFTFIRIAPVIAISEVKSVLKGFGRDHKKIHD